MNLLHLHYFHVVAKEGGFSHASKLLRIQQPAISRMVKQLEGNLGFSLFERVGRRVRLTTQGRQVFEYSKKIFAEVDNLNASVSELAGVAKGPLAIGAAEPIASHFIPEVLRNLLKSFPQLYPQIYSGPASSLMEKISNGQLEFGLFFHIPLLPESLRKNVLKKVHFYLVVRKDLKKNAKVLSSFIGSREIDDTGTRTFPTLEKLKKIHPEAQIKISSNNLTAHKAMVENGLGVAVLPDFLVEQDIKTGRFADVLPHENLGFELKLVQRENAILGLNAKTFLNECAQL